MNIKNQLKNRYFWLSIVSLMVLVTQQFGWNILPENFQEFTNSVLTILVGMGILNNNHTEGFGE